MANTPELQEWGRGGAPQEVEGVPTIQLENKKHFPFFMVGISLVEIGFFVFDSIHYELGWEDYGNTFPYNHSLILNPTRRVEVWRLYTYSLVHAGGQHLFFNMLLQLVTGIPLEVESGSLKVGLVHTVGVLVASLRWGLMGAGADFGAGASGGSYCIAAAKLSNVISNFPCRRTPEEAISIEQDILPPVNTIRETRSVVCSSLWVLIIISLTVGVEMYSTWCCVVYYQSVNYEQSWTSYWYRCRAHVAHLTATVEGACLGLVFLKNRTVDRWTALVVRVVWGVAGAIVLATILSLSYSVTTA